MLGGMHHHSPCLSLGLLAAASASGLSSPSPEVFPPLTMLVEGELLSLLVRRPKEGQKSEVSLKCQDADGVQKELP